MDLPELHELTLQILRVRFERLREGQTNEGQFRQDLNAGQITDDVAFQSYKLGLWTPDRPLPGDEPRFAGDQFPAEDKGTVLSIIWQFVGLGVLIPRMITDERNQFFDLSKYGKQVLEEGDETPYDPLGFMKRLASDAPRLEPATFGYVQEAVDCFLGRHLRAAAVMVGLASENEILTLIELFRNGLAANLQSGFDQAINARRTLKTKFDYLYTRLNQDKNNFPAEVRELDAWLTGTFQVIRLYRNDAGHPTGTSPTRETVYSTLNLFLVYARLLSRLKEHLSSSAADT